MVGTTEGILITLMSSGLEPSLNDDKVGVLASKGISPSSDENILAVITQTLVRMTWVIS